MELKIFARKEELFLFAANRFAALAQQAVERRGRFLVSLSGGGTPIPLHKLLSEQLYREQIPWNHTHVFWGDERCVPPDHVDSNYKQSKETLLDKVPLLKENIHRIRGELAPQDAALEYTKCLKGFAESAMEWPHFDLVILGLGSDGHTASLMSGSPIATSAATLVTESKYQKRPAGRVTLSSGVFNDAYRVMFLVTGEDKADALSAVLEGERDFVRWPAQRIDPTAGKVLWVVDTAAASRLSNQNQILGVAHDELT